MIRPRKFKGKKRDNEIVRMIDELRMTQTAVGKFFDITKQRVGHIYKRQKNVQNIRTTGDGKNNNAA